MRQTLMIVFVGCGTAAPTTEPAMTTHGSASRVEAAPAASGLVACTPPTAPELVSYWDVTMPAIYWVDMIYADTFWRPVKNIPMPYHHATGIELVNLAAFPQVAGRTAPVRFTLEITSRDIDKVPDEYEWHTKYHARIIDVCIP